MQDNKWIFGLIIILALVGFAVWGFGKGNVKKAVSGETSTATNSNKVEEITPNEPYFSADAKVMYFYQPKCHYCLLQSPILSELAQEGYRVKSMDATTNADFWAQLSNGQDNPKSVYKIKGTPSFIADNGDRLEGMQQKEALKAFLDSHK